jgi:hypothetical protein
MDKIIEWPKEEGQTYNVRQNTTTHQPEIDHTNPTKMDVNLCAPEE